MTDAASRQAPPQPLEWVKPPQQARSQKTLKRILDGAEAFIVENGVHALTVSAVVARARSSVGAFYARFTDKNALLSTLHERECEEALATSQAALDPGRWDGVAIEDAIGQVVDFVVQLFVERRTLVLAFRSLGASDGGFAERRARLVADVAACLRRFLESRADELSHPDLRLASDVCVRILFGTLEAECSECGIVASAGPYPAERLADELAGAVLGYLGVTINPRIRRPDLTPVR